MSESRSIQPYQNRVPAGALMTPQGPAVIQIIDMPSTGTELGPVGGVIPPRRGQAANILSAVLRRWWLVALVTLVIGGATLFAAGKFVLPQWEARCRISYLDTSEVNGHGPIHDIINNVKNLLTSRDIPLRAIKDPELQDVFPALLKNRPLDDPIVQTEILDKLRALEIVDWDENIQGGNVLDIVALRPTKEEAKKVADSFGRAVRDYCTDCASSSSNRMRTEIEAEIENDRALYENLSKASTKLKLDSNFEANLKKNEVALNQISKFSEARAEAQAALQAAQNTYNRLKDDTHRGPAQQLEREKMIEEEKAKDVLLAGYTAQLVAAVSKYESEVAGGKTPEHPDVIAAGKQVERIKQKINERDAEIKDAIDKKIAHQQDLIGQVNVAGAQDAIDRAQGLIDYYNKQLNEANEETRRLAVAKLQLDDLDRKMKSVDEHRTENEKLLTQIKTEEITHPVTKTFEIAEWATPKLKEDKSVKVKAAGMVLGLFMGILLALLVDKFDKRLRDPRDLEPIVGAPLLGTIPRIQELKRIKGEQARNLIAEEFRIIRTQVLFGNPNLSHKIIAITSPAPGDGKTSLAVNLAISIAKSGRRTLLIDGDLRKPDIHRVFNVPDNPGFAELIQGSHDAAAVIRKSEIDGLDILPAGTPIARPSELLSRPDMQRILATLGELYDHIVMDTAPLLPVSDTHILVGMVDGVICSFNAEVDRDTVALCQEILRRSHANVIGSVMNQVKYKQSGSYHRGKTSYESYYTSPRGSRQAAAAKAEVASLPKAS